MLGDDATLGGGSSLHTRGAQGVKWTLDTTSRIIPAYAGSTARRGVPGATRWDHPRIRGEHIVGSIGMVIGWGSSPHTRGAHSFRIGSGAFPRIIPAYAGSTAETRLDPVPETGSSPHTRGAPGVRGERGHGDGIIPAYAGSTGYLLFAFSEFGIIPAYAGSTDAGVEMLGGAQDHPRIRGEHSRPPPFE